MANNACTGDCTKCPAPQQIYCASQRTYAIMRNQEAIIAHLEEIEGRLAAFSSQEPVIRLLDDEAQRGSGAENREP